MPTPKKKPTKRKTRKKTTSRSAPAGKRKAKKKPPPRRPVAEPGLDTWGGISSAAVKKATGRSWSEWLDVLDRAGAPKMTHKAIAQTLHAAHDVGDWWSQMVAVGYEQARGLRKKHEKSDGFSASASRVVEAPIEALYRAWSHPPLRASWMGARAKDRITIRKATPNKSMRITWIDGTSVEVNFYRKGPGRSQVQVQQSRMAAEDDVGKAKRYWAGAMKRMKAGLES